MYGYYSGDNERNDYDNIQQLDTENIDMEVQEKRLSRAPTVDFNHKMLKKKHTSQIDIDKARREAKELLRETGGDKDTDEKLMFKKQSVSIFRIYSHLFESIDWLFLVLATIGAIGAGISMPIMSYTMSDAFSDVGNTSEERTSAEAMEQMFQMVEDAMEDQIKKQLIYGAISFVCNFLSVCFWSLIGNRCIYNLKKKYFTTILSQEQGWFDSNNAFEFATKVQAQLEQVEQGIGDKIGLVISFYYILFSFLNARFEERNSLIKKNMGISWRYS